MTEERTEERAEELPAEAVRERAPEVATSARGMRARLARMGTKSQPGNPVLEPLFNAVRANHPKADLALLERAYVTAEKMHGTQMRKSGDPYITHPLAVTTILADIGMTEPTLVASLLHDTVEDTPYTLDQLTIDFGKEVGALVDGVTKLDKVEYGDSARGRDHPQDDRGDVARHQGAGDQARRPAAQHAHPALRAPRVAGAHGTRRPSTSTRRWPTGSA